MSDHPQFIGNFTLPPYKKKQGLESNVRQNGLLHEKKNNAISLGT